MAQENSNYVMEHVEGIGFEQENGFLVTSTVLSKLEN